ncbi:MAG: leucyl/phenylalanyl-tRNA--protein transferase [Wenzhouxiangellaceae bacterium]|nr:leucyl/phenylalanyl-tRNA--protein transferase [Wenzhouxiangellaceae bacterium]
MPFSVPILADAPDTRFPDPAACRHPDGLVAIGGGLERERLLAAYQNGIFPWYEPGGPILWWSPNPRIVIEPERFHSPRRLARTWRQRRHRVTLDQAFEAVIDACAEPRDYADGTWITPEMRTAYVDLHRAGHAHSVEIWHDDRLTGGLYGVALGRIFFAESKFHRARDASKLALVELMQVLKRHNFKLCDCQLWNRHLQQFDVRMVERDAFLAQVRSSATEPSAWPAGPSLLQPESGETNERID